MARRSRGDRRPPTFVRLTRARLPPRPRHPGALRKLDISNNFLSGQLPAAVRAFTELEELDISDNMVSGIPVEAAAWRKLRSFTAKRNALAVLPPECVEAWAALERMDVSYNRLAVLPDQIGRLGQLRRLMFTNNKLAAVPTELGFLTSLEELHVRGARPFCSCVCSPDAHPRCVAPAAGGRQHDHGAAAVAGGVPRHPVASLWAQRHHGVAGGALPRAHRVAGAPHVPE